MIRFLFNPRCRYKLIFEPQKTVSAKVELAVEKSTGGRWRFELRLEATQPDVDGSITIQAAPGRSALGPLHLFSPTDQPEHFTCHFSYDSPISFDVSPAEVSALRLARQLLVDSWRDCLRSESCKSAQLSPMIG